MIITKDKASTVCAEFAAYVVQSTFHFARQIAGAFKKVWARRYVRIPLLVGLILMGHALVFSQGNAMGDTTGTETTIGTEPIAVAPGVNASVVIQMISSAVNNAVNQTSATLDGYGPGLIMFGVAIMMIWTGIKCLMAAKGLGEIFAEWVPIWVTAGVCSMLVVDGARTQIQDTMYSIATAVAGTDMRRVDNVIATTLSNMLAAIRDVLFMPGMGNLTWADFITGSALTLILSIVIMLIGKIVTIFLLLLAAVIVIANMLMAAISLKLAMALGAIMIPFMIVRPLAWIWESWLKFTIGSGMMLVVGAFFIRFSNSVTSQMLLLSTQAKADAGGQDLQALINDFTLYAGLIIIAGVVALLAAQIPSLGSGLVSGQSSGGGFGGLKGITQASGTKMALAGAGAMAGGSVMAGKMAASRGAADAAGGLAASPQRGGSSRAQQQAYQTAYKSGNPGAQAVESAGRRGFADAEAGNAMTWKSGNAQMDQTYQSSYKNATFPDNHPRVQEAASRGAADKLAGNAGSWNYGNNQLNQVYKTAYSKG